MSIQKWVLDESHSVVEFQVKHLMIAKVRGVFEAFSAEVEADLDDLTTASVKFKVDLSSVNTRNGDRDNHLKSADFFDVENNPTLDFKATSIIDNGNHNYSVVGDLTLHGITKSETFNLTFEGSSVDPWGNTKVGFSVTGTINRSDYNLTYNAALETGGVLIGDDVKINLELELAQA